MADPVSWSDAVRTIKREKVTLPWERKGLAPEPVKYVTRYEKAREEVVFDPILGRYRDEGRVRDCRCPSCIFLSSIVGCVRRRRVSCVWCCQDVAARREEERRLTEQSNRARVSDDSPCAPRAHSACIMLICTRTWCGCCADVVLGGGQPARCVWCASLAGQATHADADVQHHHPPPGRRRARACSASHQDRRLSAAVQHREQPRPLNPSLCAAGGEVSELCRRDAHHGLRWMASPVMCTPSRPLLHPPPLQLSLEG
jgi:hypothetical protein